MKQECGDIRWLLDAWIDEELSSSDARRVARHLEGCPDCRDAVESRRGIDAALAADNRAGDPGDAYFRALGDRINAKFDFAEASRHWAKPTEPPRRRRLTVPRAWVPRFAFGIAGAAVATIAGLLVHDLGEQPMLAPFRQVTDSVLEGREPQMPVVLPGSPAETQIAQGAAAPSTRLKAAPSAGPTVAPSLPAMARPSGSPAVAQLPPPTVRPPASPTVAPPDQLMEPARELRWREPTPVPAGSNLAAQSKRRVADSLAPEMKKGSPEREANGSTFAADLTAPDLTAADLTAPDRPALLAFFGALTETGEERTALSPIEALSVSSHEVSDAGTDLAGSTRTGLRQDKMRTRADSISIRLHRDEATILADSTWIRMRRDEARALADSALAAGTLEGCESALRAYWAMLHRDGRSLLPAPSARAQAVEPDRLRIAALLRCASR
jgi:anti-sigma factor RsiW